MAWPPGLAHPSDYADGVCIDRGVRVVSTRIPFSDIEIGRVGDGEER